MSHEDDKQSKGSEPSTNSKVSDDLSALTSTGPLSNLTRVGIMLALLGVERMTFSNLLVAVKMSKSSLSGSLNILEENGLINVRKGFSAFGGPRTFIQITEAGKIAIRTHLETLHRLSKNYLDRTGNKN